MAKRLPTPEPIIVTQVCSICGEAWHEDDPTLTGCIAALKARPVPQAQPCTLPHYPCYVYPRTYPLEWWQTVQPYQWSYTNDATSNVIYLNGATRSAEGDDGESGVRVPA